MSDKHNKFPLRAPAKLIFLLRCSNLKPIFINMWMRNLFVSEQRNLAIERTLSKSIILFERRFA